ncbi:diaminobutyrate acetyltransferase [Tropicibacter sp. S64]|uniref:diaminobutyrate acetyltransferase n=1 Tax=Tropicibacter sp. S64 TaxID=3415122 RepID=UPI003C7C5E34
MRDLSDTAPKGTLTFRKPVREDGAAIWSLIGDCKPLDENSMYCNLLQADHFRDTCIVAEMDGEIVGWVSGYLLPHDAETLFVWQVAVSETARGRGVGGRMLSALFERVEKDGVRRIQTTITRDNDASWALFTGFADRQDALISDEAHFTRDTHFDGNHDTEHMVTIDMPAALRRVA